MTPQENARLSLPQTSVYGNGAKEMENSCKKKKIEIHFNAVDVFEFLFPFLTILILNPTKKRIRSSPRSSWVRECGGKNSWKGKFYGNSSAIYHSTLTVQFSYQLEWEQLKNLRVKNKIRKKGKRENRKIEMTQERG